MTRDQVEQAINALQANAQPVSDRKILAAIGAGSLRDVVRFRRELVPSVDLSTQVDDLRQSLAALVPACAAVLEMDLTMSQWDELLTLVPDRLAALENEHARLSQECGQLEGERDQLASQVTQLRRERDAIRSELSDMVTFGGNRWPST